MLAPVPLAGSEHSEHKQPAGCCGVLQATYGDRRNHRAQDRGRLKWLVGCVCELLEDTIFWPINAPIDI